MKEQVPLDCSVHVVIYPSDYLEISSGMIYNYFQSMDQSTRLAQRKTTLVTISNGGTKQATFWGSAGVGV